MKPIAVFLIVSLLSFGVAGCGDGDGVWMGANGAPADGDGLAGDPGGAADGNGDGLAGDPGGAADGDGLAGDPDDAGKAFQLSVRSCSGNNDPFCNDRRIEARELVAVIEWKIKNTIVAAIRLDAPRNSDPFAYTSFIGDPEKPYLGRMPLDNVLDDDMLESVGQLLIDPLDEFDNLSDAILQRIATDEKSLPFNYCWSNVGKGDESRCADDYDSSEGIQGLPWSYLYVFLPAGSDPSGETSGKWLMPLSSNPGSGVRAFYRDQLSDAVRQLTPSR